jgi:hypothetical protein
VPARHKKQRNLFTHHCKLSKITAAIAGVAVAVPAAVAAGLTASATTGGSSPSLLAMAGSRPDARVATGHPHVGIPRAGAARRTIATLSVNRVLAQRAAERAAHRRAARRAARLAAERAAAAATSSGTSNAPGTASSAPQPAGNPRQIAEGMLRSYGWPSSQFGCLESLWNEESGWNTYAQNPSSGAYGIPQALPGSKMASAGPDWQTDAATQIRWGLGYIKSLYGSPCGAWRHEQATGWY